MGASKGGMEVWGRRLYLSLHCHLQTDSCIKMGSDESHFDASLTVRDKVTRQCPQTTTFEEKGEPKRNRTEVPLPTSLAPCRCAKPAHGSRLVHIPSLPPFPPTLRHSLHTHSCKTVCCARTSAVAAAALGHSQNLVNGASTPPCSSTWTGHPDQACHS